MSWGGVDEEDEEAIVERKDRRRFCCEVGRPRTPEPSLVEFYEDDHHRSKPRFNAPQDLIRRLETLSGQLESALELSQSLQAQRTTPQKAIQLLELKVTETGQRSGPCTRSQGDHSHFAW